MNLTDAAGSATESIDNNPARAGSDAGLKAAESSAQAGTAREKAAHQVIAAKKALDEAEKLEAEAAAADRTSQAQAARERAAQLMSERRYSEAKKALSEAEQFEKEAAGADRRVQAQACRERAVQLMAEQRYTEAKKALEEAEELESDSSRWKAGPQRVFTAIRSRIPKSSGAAAPTAAPAKGDAAPTAEVDAVTESGRIIGLYSKIAAVVGLLPGGLLNFGAILAVQIIMVWRISNAFGHHEGKEKIRGSILSLFGSILPTGIGHGAGVAIASIPAVLTGTVVYFLVTPVLAYAMTRAVGNVFVMHFESGGTLLTFDAKAFGEYFVTEFQKAGGSVKTAPADSPIIQTA